MNNFPVASSILSAYHIALFLQQQYGWVDVPFCRIIKAGVNHTYLVKTTGGVQYVFRVYSYDWRSATEIEEEIRLVNHLHQNDVPVSIPVTDSKGSYMQQLAAPEGMRYGVLFTYARGEKLHNFSADLHYKAGRLMAEMHLLTKGFDLERVQYDSSILLANPFEKLKEFISATTEEMQFLYNAKAYLQRLLQTADENSLRKGAVHLDIWFDNMNIDPDGNITLFDFDFCGNGWLCLDIAYYLMQLYVVEPVAAEYDSKSAAFLHGYETVTVLTTEEKRLLPALGICLYFFYLGVQCSRFDDWSNIFINETYLKRFITVRVKKHFDFHGLGKAAMETDSLM